jgi:multidrug resistance efflux pump
MKLPRPTVTVWAALALATVATGGLLTFIDTSQADDDPRGDDGPPIVAAARGRIEVEGGLLRVLATRDGVVRDVSVVEGQHIAASDVLARLDARDAELALVAAEAAVEEAKARQTALENRRVVRLRQLDRVRRAAKEQAVSPQALDDEEAAMSALMGDLRSADAGVALAGAKRDAARAELERRQIRSALSGRVARRAVKPGDVVSAAALTEMFVIIPDAPLVVRAEIQETFVRQVEPGMAAEIVAETDERVRATGRVIRVGGYLDTRRASESATERADVRVADSLLEIDMPETFLIGQRVYVRFRTN